MSRNAQNSHTAVRPFRCTSWRCPEHKRRARRLGYVSVRVMKSKCICHAASTQPTRCPLAEERDGWCSDTRCHGRWCSDYHPHGGERAHVVLVVGRAGGECNGAGTVVHYWPLPAPVAVAVAVVAAMLASQAAVIWVRSWSCWAMRRA